MQESVIDFFIPQCQMKNIPTKNFGICDDEDDGQMGRNSTKSDRKAD